MTAFKLHKEMGEKWKETDKERPFSVFLLAKRKVISKSSSAD